MKYREPAVAGSFYTDSPTLLKSEIEAFIAAKDLPEIKPHALIVPHAGYCYSGAVAGAGYAYLKKNAGTLSTGTIIDSIADTNIINSAINSKIKRVVLLGPSHHVFLQGCAISSYQYFNTPLGQIKVASECYQPLLDAHLVQVCDPAHLSEHALEVQLPFLQLTLSEFEIVPIVVGECSPDIVSKILHELHVDDPETLVVVSSDLSHFHPYSQAKILDQDTIDRILRYNTALSGHDACGCHAINGLLNYAKQQNWQVKLTKQANSGDVIADKERVVGYASFILY